MTTAVIVNDQSLAAFGFITGSVSGVLDAVGGTYPTAKVPGRVGVVRTGRLPEVPAREIRVTGHIVVAQNRPDLLDPAIGRLKQWLDGDLEIRTGHDLTKFYRATLTGGVITAMDPQFLAHAAAATLAFTCDDPRAYAAEASVVGFSATRAQCALGTAPSEPVIRVMGPATDPVVTYRKANGTPVAYHRFAGTLGSSDFLTVSTSALTVRLSTAGAETNAVSWLHPTDPGDFITLDPRDGDAGVGAWGTVEVSSGTGEAIYARTYL